MTKRKKIGLWAAGIVGSILILLVIAIIAVPFVVDQDRIKDKLRTALSQRAGGEIDFSAMHATVLPPGGEISEVRVDLPDIRGTAESVDADLDFWQLLRGKFKIDDIVIRDPNFAISLPKPSETKDPRKEEQTPEQVRKKLAELFSRIGEKMPNATIAIRNGTVLLTKRGETLYSFKEMNARIVLPPDSVQMNLAASSNVWDTLTFSGKIDADGTDASGELNVQELRPKSLARYFAPGVPKEFESARVSMEVDFQSPNLESIKGNLRGSAVYEKIPYPVEITESAFAFSRKGLFLNDFNIRAGESHVGASWARLTLGEEKNLTIESAAAELRMGRIFPWALPLLSRIEGVEEIADDYEEVKGNFSFVSFELQGPLSQPEEWKFEGEGAFQNFLLETGYLPGALAIPKGEFAVGPKTVSLKKMQLGIFGSLFTVSGNINGYRDGVSSVDLKLSGTLSKEAAAWLKENELTPEWLNISAPVQASEGHIVWGRHKNTVFSADLAMENGPEVSLSLVNGPEKLNIQNLTIEDANTQATMSMTLGDEIVNLAFKGNIDGETLDKLVTLERNLEGWIRGDFNLHAPVQNPKQARVKGNIQAGGITYAAGLRAPVLVKELSLQGEGDKIRIDSADLVWRKTDIALDGNIGFSSKGIVLDLAATTEGFTWEKIDRIVEEETAEATETAEKEDVSEQEGAFGDLQLEGKAVLKADYFKYGDIVWEPFHVTVNLENNRIGLQLSEGALCDIQTEASAKVSPEPLRVEAEAEAQDKRLQPALECFLENRLMSGEFDLAGDFMTRGKPANLMDNLQGQFNFNAEDGRIFRFGLLAKVLAVVNISEILKLRAPDLRKEGFGYRSIKASGVIEDGVLTLEETHIEGRSVDLVFVGSLDIPEEQVDLTVLVTPLKTVDSIIERIPIVGHIAGENFMAIPVRVRGDLSDPSVTPMSPSAVGKGLLGIVKRTLTLPVKVVQPFLPEEAKK